MLDLARLDDVEGQQARGFGIGDIDRALVGRQPDAVRRQHRIHQLDDFRAVRQRVIEPTIVAMRRVPLTEIGEIEPALAVEHDVVRRRQFAAVELAVEHARLAGLQIDALDRAALVIGPGAGRQKARCRLIDGAAIVADIERAVRAGRDAVRPAARLADLGFAAVRRDTRHLPAGDLAEDDRAVGHPYRPLWKAEVARQDLDIGHCGLPAQLLTWRMMSTQRSSWGRILSAGSGGRPATTRVTPRSR